jgi:hypothetical protein
VKVIGYRVYRDGAPVDSVTTTKWSDGLALAIGAARTYYIVAYDEAGNVSVPSKAVSVP